MVMPYHLHMPSYFLETFTEYPKIKGADYRSALPMDYLMCIYKSFSNLPLYCPFFPVIFPYSTACTGQTW